MSRSPVQRKLWKQTKFFGGDGAKGGGNCTEAAIASLLGVDLDDIPELHDPELANDDPEQLRGFWDRFEKVFEDFGYFVHFMPPEFGHPGSLHLVSGPSARGCQHMVVYNHDELAWDPHPSDEGIESIKFIYWITPINPRPMEAQ